MSAPTAELSSLSSSLDELVGRLGDLAERFAAAGRTDVAQELYEVERTMAGGQRRLARVIARR